MKTGKLRAVDLFAGVGGIRLAFERAFGDEIKTVWACEIDKFARRTYEENFRDVLPPASDITKVDVADVPDHDVLLAGFPCQTFSISGVSKYNSLGRPHGFADKTRGTMFFEVARILEAKRPAAFLLENVRNLVSHDRGRTFRTIMSVLEDELGYHVHWKVVDGRHWTPQHRERIYIVGFADDVPFDWDDLEVPESGGTFGDVRQRDVDPKYTVSDRMWDWLRSHAEKHRAMGHGFGYSVIGDEDVTRTISARYHKDGSECLVLQEGRNPRRLTPRECARLQGFPDEFEIPVSDTQAYRQFGNSVCVPAVEAVARLMRRALAEGDER